MTPQQYVERQIYQGAMDKGAKETIAKAQALTGSNMYAKGQFKKATDLIKDQIMQAKKLSKNA